MSERRGTRATGTNPRRVGTNPRALATNPSAGQRTDADRHARMLRQARARHYVATGERWCVACDDTGWIGEGAVSPCPDHRPMSYGQAWEILHPVDD